MGSVLASDEIEEHLKWAAEWIEDAESTTTSRPLPLGQVSRAAAPVGDTILRDSRAPFPGGDSPTDPSGPPKPFQASTLPTLDSTPVRPLGAHRRSIVRLGSVGTVILLPAIVVFLVMELPFSRFWQQRQVNDYILELASSSTQKQAERGQPEPQLLAREGRGVAGEPIRLGLTLRGQAPGGVVIVAGLAPGMTLSSGGPVGANAWQVDATNLADTWIGPPQNQLVLNGLQVLPPRTRRHLPQVRLVQSHRRPSVLRPRTNCQASQFAGAQSRCRSPQVRPAQKMSQSPQLVPVLNRCR
jgi:hypothetical protein